LQFADQTGQVVEPCHGRAGVGWIRMVTDIPTSISGIVHGRLALHTYLNSLKEFSVESVYGREDILPTLVEIALIPYLAVKRGY
jgi:D-aspartate ligase